MIDPTIQKKVIQAASLAAKRAKQIDITSWWQKLTQINREKARELIHAKQDSYRYGAIPTWEAPGLVQFPSASPLPTLGIDGSQIYPEPRQPVLWTYIQALGYEKGENPQFVSEFFDLSSILAGETKQPSGYGNVHFQWGLGSETINYWRALLELKLAYQICQNDGKKLLLLDNSLLPWIGIADIGQDVRIKAYLDLLVQTENRLLAGYISGPRSRLVTQLIHLWDEEKNNGTPSQSGINDGLLMGFGLQPGQRSALFLHAGPRNKTFADAGAAIYFFFLRINDYEVARVEIPAWVANDTQAVDRVHASIINDSQALGYPYVLALAHHNVVIKRSVGGTLSRLASSTYIDQGGYYHLPAKLRMKALLRS